MQCLSWDQLTAQISLGTACTSIAPPFSGLIYLLSCQQNQPRSKEPSAQAHVVQRHTDPRIHIGSSMQKLTQEIRCTKSWSLQQIKQFSFDVAIAKTFQRLTSSHVWIKPKYKRGCDVSNPTKEIQQQKQEEEQFPDLLHRNIPVLGQGDSCLRGGSLDTSFYKERIASSVFPQRLSLRQSLCSSQLHACNASLFSQFATEKHSAGPPLTTSL